MRAKPVSSQVGVILAEFSLFDETLNASLCTVHPRFLVIFENGISFGRTQSSVAVHSTVGKIENRLSRPIVLLIKPKPRSGVRHNCCLPFSTFFMEMVMLIAQTSLANSGIDRCLDSNLSGSECGDDVVLLRGEGFFNV